MVSGGFETTYSQVILADKFYFTSIKRFKVNSLFRQLMDEQWMHLQSTIS